MLTFATSPTLHDRRRAAARCSCAIFAALASLPAVASETATLLRYEYAFGPRTTTHTIALAWRPTGEPDAAFPEVRLDEPRLTLFSSNPRNWALLNAYPSEGDENEATSGSSFGHALAALALGAAVVAGLAGVAKDVKELLDFELDFPAPPILPAPPAPSPPGGG